MITKPVRMYLLLLFIAVLGIGGYMLLKQQNDDYDNVQTQAGQNVKSAPVTPLPTATATPVTINADTTLDNTAEASNLDKLLSSVPTSDFDSSTLSSSIGF